MSSVVPVPTQVTGRLSGLDGLTPLTATTATSDPQAAYRRLRDRWGPVAPVELEPGVNAWLVMGYDELRLVLKHERVFSRDPCFWRDYAEGRVPADSRLGPVMFPREHAYFKDGDVHRMLRAPLVESVRGLPLRRVSRANRQICADLIAGFAGNGRADLVADYAVLIPLLAIGKVAGLDIASGRELLSCPHRLFASGEEARTANQRYKEILTNLMRSRRDASCDNLASAFVSHKNLLDDTEAVQAIVLMVAAGLESTMAWIAQTLRLMLTDPRFAGRLRGGRLSVDDALDEVLWRDPPQANLPARFALRDVVLAGQPVGAGDALILALAAANADPRVHRDNRWDEIGNQSHLSWSAGPHACPARVPARIIAKSAIETVLHLLPDIRLTVPAEEIASIPSPWNRCPASLPVTFTPAPARRGQPAASSGA
jgi:cytochrome P450